MNKRTERDDIHYCILEKNIKLLQKQKELLVIFLMFLSFSLNAQDKRFTFYGCVDPYSTHVRGFNIAFGIEYQMTYTYVKSQLLFYPDLNGKNYIEWSSVPFTAINLHSNNEKLRVYSGFKVGLIKRDYTHPLIGFEGGIDYYFCNSIYIGLMSSYDLRTDGKESDNDVVDYWQFNNFFKIGFQW